MKDILFDFLGFIVKTWEELIILVIYWSSTEVRNHPLGFLIAIIGVFGISLFKRSNIFPKD